MIVKCWSRIANGYWLTHVVDNDRGQQQTSEHHIGILLRGERSILFIILEHLNFLARNINRLIECESVFVKTEGFFDGFFSFRNINADVAVIDVEVEHVVLAVNGCFCPVKHQIADKLIKFGLVFGNVLRDAVHVHDIARAGSFQRDSVLIFADVHDDEKEITLISFVTSCSSTAVRRREIVQVLIVCVEADYWSGLVAKCIGWGDGLCEFICQFCAYGDVVFIKLHGEWISSIVLGGMGKHIKHPPMFRTCQHSSGLFKILLGAYGCGLVENVFLVFQARGEQQCRHHQQQIYKYFLFHFQSSLI